MCASLHEMFPWYLSFSWRDLYSFPLYCFPLFLHIDHWGRLSYLSLLSLAAIFLLWFNLLSTRPMPDSVFPLLILYLYECSYTNRHLVVFLILNPTLCMPLISIVCFCIINHSKIWLLKTTLFYFSKFCGLAEWFICYFCLVCSYVWIPRVCSNLFKRKTSLSSETESNHESLDACNQLTWTKNWHIVNTDTGTLSPLYSSCQNKV